MADTVSTILDYLRQHHFLQAEAALKAELAGREISNGLFSIDVDLGIRSVQENVEKLVLGEDSKPLQEVFEPEGTEVWHTATQLLDLGCTAEALLGDKKPLEQPLGNCLGSSENSTTVGKTLESSFTKGFGQAQGRSLENNQQRGGRDVFKGSDNNKEKVTPANSEELTEKFWEQKDKVLWVPGNKQELGKVHPLEEVGCKTKEQKQNAAWHQSGSKPMNEVPTAKEKEENLMAIQDPMEKKFGSSCVTTEGDLMQLRLQNEAVADSQVVACSELDVTTFSGKARTQSETLERTEGLPRLPPVRLKSAEKIPEDWMPNCRFNTEADVATVALEASYGLGSYLDVPVGQDISSGTKRSGGSNRPSVSHGIVEDSAELLTFRTVADDYPDEYWDSDDYEDDDDPGYTRRPIDDEPTFLANEVTYPNEEERARAMESAGQQGAGYGKFDDDDRSFVESYFSGEEYYKSRSAGATGKVESNAEFQQGKEYDGQLLDSEELKQIRSEPAWQGFVVQGSAIGKTQIEAGTGVLDLDPDDFSREIRETYLAESSGEGEPQECDYRTQNCYDLQRFGGVQVGDTNSAEDEDIVLQYYSRTWVEKTHANGCEQFSVSDMPLERMENQLQDEQLGGFQFGGFSFPSPSSGGEVEGSRAESGRSLWSARDISSRGEEADHFTNGFVGPDDTLASWKRKSNESSPIISPGEEHDIDLPLSTRSTCSPRSSECLSVEEEEHVDEEDADVQREDTEVAAAYDEEAIAVHEHYQRLQAEEEEFETFELKIVHRKNRTGFEEEKDFPVVINSVIAGRYHVTEYLGSAAFSKAIQAHDLHTGMDVCMKIIKNNKDFFDQSLDEIKLLKYINKHDPADKYHILRLYDYFYHREHLFIVCELLRANLYEFHKYNRDSGGEVYFTMPRLQSIARQCLEALEFLHNLGLIHCDLKPENILVKSYSRCEVKVIDLGSSCFQSDHLCSYVQSRSYRAPEVILGLPYDQKIDIWSLGCILAELCSGNVLFQNDSLATLLARVVGIIGPLDPEMVARGRDSFKFLSRNNMLYDRNQETNRIEYLIPKKTTLAHRLPMGDQGFVDFVRYLLQINPKNRPTASEALKHAWLSFPYEPISS